MASVDVLASRPGGPNGNGVLHSEAHAPPEGTVDRRPQSTESSTVQHLLEDLGARSDIDVTEILQAIADVEEFGATIGKRRRELLATADAMGLKTQLTPERVHRVRQWLERPAEGL